MTLDLQELETLLILVRERHGYLCEHTQAPQAARDKLIRLENKLLAAMLAEADDKKVDAPENDMRGAHAFEARKDGSLVIYATCLTAIHVEPDRVAAVLAACGDALARKPGLR